MNIFKSHSEKLVADYLDNAGLYWDYEKAWGNLHPDFTVYLDKNKKNVVVVIEVEDVEYTKKEQQELKTKGSIFRQEIHINTSERKLKKRANS